MSGGPEDSASAGAVARGEAPSLASSRLFTAARELLKRPGRTSSLLLLVAVAVEVGQYWPEIFPGAHAIGEISRSLAFAFLGAVIFHWVVVAYPEGRRMRSAYAFHELDLQLLVTIGLGLLNDSRRVAAVLGIEKGFDARRQEDVMEVCAEVWRLAPAEYRQSRLSLLGVSIMGASTALEGLSRGAPYFDPDVGQALAQFPTTTGIQQLQLLSLDDPEQAARDGHVVWQLLEGGRRVYNSLLDTAPYVDLKVGGMSVSYPDGTVVFHDPADLRPVDEN